MHSNPLRKNLKPHLWFQLYWVIYLIWFFWLDLTVKNPKYIIHAPLDDLIPFCEWFVFPYCSWFFLLAGVTALLWWYDTASYDKLCLMMFSGMTFCLVLYMVLPNGLDIRPRRRPLAGTTSPCGSCRCSGTRTLPSTSAPPSTARAPAAWRWRSPAASWPKTAPA